jgi:hypothetical protein
MSVRQTDDPVYSTNYLRNLFDLSSLLRTGYERLENSKNVFAAP